MGLKDVEALRSFCLELSSDQPSPGGGSASAAAGAMSASLMIMVCGVTAKSKKHINHWPELNDLKNDLVKIRESLISLSEQDAAAYDMVSTASRKRKEADTEENQKEFQKSLRVATEIPARTAAECCGLLEKSVLVADLQTKSAWSDTFVAVMLAEAAFGGASANVEINLAHIIDPDFVRSTREDIRDQTAKMKVFVKDSLTKLRRPA